MEFFTSFIAVFFCLGLCSGLPTKLDRQRRSFPPSSIAQGVMTAPEIHRMMQQLSERQCKAYGGHCITVTQQGCYGMINRRSCYGHGRACCIMKPDSFRRRISRAAQSGVSQRGRVRGRPAADEPADDTSASSQEPDESEIISTTPSDPTETSALPTTTASDNFNTSATNPTGSSSTKKPSIKVSCRPGDILVELSKERLAPGTDPADTSLIDTMCKPDNIDNEFVEFSFGFGDCGTTLTQGAKFIIIRNRLILPHEKSDTVITRLNDKSIDVICVYDRTVSGVQTAYRSIIRDEARGSEMGQGVLGFMFLIYTDLQYTNMLSPTAPPVALNTPLYFSLDIDAALPGMEAILKSLVATPTPQLEGAEKVYEIVANGCVKDKTFVIVSITPEHFRFSLRSFAFLGFSKVYLHATVITCSTANVAAETDDCLIPRVDNPGCAGNGTEHGRKKRSVTSRNSMFDISYGPIALFSDPILTEAVQSDDRNSNEHFPRPNQKPFTMGVLVIAILLIVYLLLVMANSWFIGYLTGSDTGNDASGSRGELNVKSIEKHVLKNASEPEYAILSGQVSVGSYPIRSFGKQKINS